MIWKRRKREMPAKKKKTPTCRFKKGDKVFLREWKDLVEEFGLDKDGDIRAESSTGTFYFVFGHNKECHGKEYFVKTVWGEERVIELDCGVEVTDTCLLPVVADYKVGDTVRILPYEEIDKEVDPVFVLPMKEFCGKTARITEIIVDEDGFKYFHLDNFKGEWSWNFGAHTFEKVEDKEPPKKRRKPKPKKERNLDFKVGEKVRIRQWDDMAEQFGVSEGGIKSVRTPTCSFVDGMSKECGRVVTITSITKEGTNKEGWVVKFEEIEYCTWTFGMIEKLDQPEEDPAPAKVELFAVGDSLLPKKFCSDCGHIKKLEGGYCWCESWHNTTIPTGFCHKFK